MCLLEALLGTKKILIVEDDPHWQRIIEKAIGKVQRGINLLNRYTVDSALNAESAKAKLKHNEYAIVTMDINLSPSENSAEGMALLQLLKDKGAQPLSIIISGEDNTNYPIQGFSKFNIFHYIPKFEDRNTLIEIRSTLKSLMLYDDALMYVQRKSWTKAINQWEAACVAQPDLTNRFKNLVELAPKHILSGLPTNELINDYLVKFLATSDKHWAVLEVNFNNIQKYYDAYGSYKGDEALKYIGQYFRQLGEENKQIEFVGQNSGKNSMVLVLSNDTFAEILAGQLLDEFNFLSSAGNGKGKHSDFLYDFLDRENGFTASKEGYDVELPIISVEVRLVTKANHPEDLEILTNPSFGRILTT